MSRAQRLRDAAKVLRDAAKAATDAVGATPWARQGEDWNESDGITYTVASIDYAAAAALYEEVGIYLTKVHPLVGLALADWLEQIAQAWHDPHADSSDDHVDFDGWPLAFEESLDSHGLRIADLILGGDS